MSLLDNQEKAIANYLGSYIFDKVWNDPRSEYRSFIKPKCLNVPLVHYKTFSIEDRREDLPDTTSRYLVFLVSKQLLRGVSNLSLSTWVTTESLSINNRLSLDIFSRSGYLLCKSKVFIRDIANTKFYALAIDRFMYINIVGTEESPENISLRVTVESDAVKDQVWYSSSFIDGVVNPNLNNPNPSLIVKDGRVLHPSKTVSSALSNLKYLDILSDGNILGQFSIPYSSLPSFNEQGSNKERYIIHIPKVINPGNSLISYITCDFIIQPNDVNVPGRYITKNIASFKQVTHNDFSILKEDIDSFLDYIVGTRDVSIRVLVRNYAKNNLLDLDKYYMKYLYTHDDSKIIEFLTGTETHNFEFWKANTLQESEYCKFISESPDYISTQNINSFINVLGYNNAISIISERQGSFIVDSTFNSSFLVKKPAIFFKDRVLLTLFIDGIKVDPSSYKIKTSGDLIKVSFLTAPTEGQLISYEIYHDVLPVTRRIAVSFLNRQITVTSNDITVYQVITESPIPSFKEYVYPKTLSTFYKEVSLASVALQINEVINFKSETIGKTFIIVENSGTSYQKIEIDDTLEMLSPLVFPTALEITEDIFDKTFDIAEHTGHSSLTGSVVQTGVTSSIPSPVWKLYSNASYEDKKWSTFTTVGTASFTYTLAPSLVSSKYLVGVAFSIDNVLDKGQIPTGFDIFIDDVLVNSNRSMDWRIEVGKVNIYFDSSVKVNNTMKIVLYSGSTTITVRGINFIFGSSTFSKSVPVLGSCDDVVYLNGKELAKDVDYTIVKPKSSNGNIGASYIVVHNCSYLNPQGNNVEFYSIYTGLYESTSTFKEQDIVIKGRDMIKYFKGLSIVTADGKQVSSTVQNYTELKITEATRNGAIVGMRTVVPASAKKFVDKYYEGNDSEIIETLFTYFTTERPQVDLVISPYSHRLVSIYIATILQDIKSGYLAVSNPLSQQAFLAQFEAYEHIKEYDLFFKQGSTINKTYVDVQPSYTQVGGDMVTYDVLKRLISLISDNVYYGRPSNEHNT